MKTIKPLIKQTVYRILQIRVIWEIYLLKKLRFKFNALYHGIAINRSTEVNLHNFRRNIHRLEKGLSYQTIKPVFAEDYILETVKIFRQAKSTKEFDVNTLNWGEAVLSKYFNTCEHSDKIKTAYQDFSLVQTQNPHPDWIPYCSEQRPESLIDYQSLYLLALKRRSVRFYLDKKVEADIVEKAMQVAALSPSACNRQAFRFLFFNEETFANKIAQVPGGVVGYRVPSIVVVVGSYRGYFDERDINAPLIDSMLAAMAFLFALETLGLSSVCINWPNLPDRERDIRKLIHLEKDEFVVMLIGVGYADPKGKIPFSAKKSLEELLLVNERKPS
jgi:nitroreductase